MSVATEITRLQTAKADIKQSIESKGVTVPSSEKISSYNTYIDSIVQGIPQLDVGGKNPVLVKEYYEEIPFSETKYPDITLTTTNQNMISSRELFTEKVDLDNYDYVLKAKVIVDVVYKEEVPFSSSYTKKAVLFHYTNVYRVANDIYSSSRTADILSNRLGTFHKANTEKDQVTYFGWMEAFQIQGTNHGLTNQNRSYIAKANSIAIKISANQMTADAWELVDAEKSTVTYDYEFYQVDKGTSNIDIAQQGMWDIVLGE